MKLPRSKKTQTAYEQFKKKHRKNVGRLEVFDLTDEVIIREFTHWVIIENRFPYDEMAKINHMLVSRRAMTSYYEGTKKELDEYYLIMKLLAQEGSYDATIENFPKARSVKKFAHTHLVVWRNTER